MYVFYHNALRNIQINMREIPNCLDIASGKKFRRFYRTFFWYREHCNINRILLDKALELINEVIREAKVKDEKL